MRLDLFLKISRLVVRRTIARELCDAGAVSVNGQPAKPAREIRIGDTLDLRLKHRRLSVQVRAVPSGKTLRTTPRELYDILSDTPVEHPEDDWGIRRVP